MATAAGISRRRVTQVLGMTGLTEVRHRRVGGFSLGMRQRLTLATALLGDPGALIMDEPLNGLDPDGIRWMRDLLRHAAGGEYRHRTIIPAMLLTPSRGALVAAKTIAIAMAGVVLAGLTFGLGLATIVIELSAHGSGHLPPGTTRMFADSVLAATLFGLIGVALGYITRSTIAAVVGAVGWVLFAELAILGTVAPQLATWLISGTAKVLTNPPGPGHAAPTPLAAAVLGGYTVALLALAAQLVLRRDVA